MPLITTASNTLPLTLPSINTNQTKPKLQINFAEVVYLPNPKEQTTSFIQSNDVTPITLSYSLKPNPFSSFNNSGNVAQKIKLFNSKPNNSNEQIRSRGNVARKIELFNAKANPNKSLTDRKILK